MVNYKRQFKKLMDKYVSLERYFKALKVENAELRAENAELQAKIDAHEAKIDAGLYELQKSKDILSSMIEELERVDSLLEITPKSNPSYRPLKNHRHDLVSKIGWKRLRVNSLEKDLGDIHA